MRLFFVRHGQSENNALWLNTGSHEKRKSDPEITEIGRQQIEHTARFLDYCLTVGGTEKYDPSLAFESGDIYLYCSLMERAVQTGTIISDQLNIPLRAFLEIHESGGIYHYDQIKEEHIGGPGYSRSMFEEKYPNLVLPEEVNETGWWNRDYEKREERPLRVKKALKKLLDWHGESQDNVIFVSHAGFYNYFMRSILEKDMDREVWFDLYNGAVTLIGFENSQIHVFFCNRYEFMPIEIVT